MQTRLTLRPHQRGAMQLLAKYGERLVCVRYRYELEPKRRLRTMALRAEGCHWVPETKGKNVGRMVPLRVAASEKEERRQVKEAGVKWNPVLGVWEISYEQVVALHLEKRIAPGQRSIYM